MTILGVTLSPVFCDVFSDAGGLSTKSGPLTQCSRGSTVQQLQLPTRALSEDENAEVRKEVPGLPFQDPAGDLHRLDDVVFIVGVCLVP